MVASYAYSRERLVDWRVVRWAATFGVPATVLAALLTRWISGGILVKVTDAVLVGLGIWILAGLQDRGVEQPADEPGGLMLAAVAVGVGLASGLLANSGGFLLAPLFVILLRLPIKSALASSLAVASVLAVPGTIVHAALGPSWRATVWASSSIGGLIDSIRGLRTAARQLPRCPFIWIAEDDGWCGDASLGDELS
jgi:uncharacterized membrane protein YfcA